MEHSHNLTTPFSGIQSHQGYAPPASTPTAPTASNTSNTYIERLEQTTELYSMLLYRVEAITNRVVGAIPQDVSETSKVSARNGSLLNRLELLNERYAAIAASIDATLDRLETAV